MRYFTLKLKTALFTLLTALIFCQISYAQSEFPVRTDPPRLVNDFAGLLSARQNGALENKLVSFYQKTSTQIAIVTVKSLSGYDKADYATKLSEQWGIGQKGKNNGILILVKPKIANEQGEVYVAVGYGLEAVVPDAVASQALIREELLPAFKQNDYFSGLDKSTDVLISLTAGEFTADQYVKAARKKGKSGSGGFIVIMIVLAIIFLFRRRTNAYGVSSGQGFLGTLLLMDLLGGGGRNSGSWNDFSGGGGDSGGDSFGGFGGGSFGGGGAGGSW